MAKEFKDLTFTDDFMFCKVMTRRPELCEEMLRLILGQKVHICKIGNQKSIKITPDGKGVRLDVYAEDDENTVYDVEMQTSTNEDLPERSRYYQGIIDLSVLESGMEYNKLKKSFVIFICTFDYFKKGLPVYTFRYRCDQNNDICLNDDTERVFINAYGRTDDMSDELREFLQFIIESKAKNSFTRNIEEEIAVIKDNPILGVEYMSINARDADMREEGRKEGRQEGRKQGIAEDRIQIAYRMLKKGISPEDITSMTGIEDEIIRQAEQKILVES